jgi:hypothetical protein
VQGDNPEVLAAREETSRGAARADAGRADAPQAGHRHCRHAWQDHHHQPGDQRAGRGGWTHLRDRRRLNSAGANAKLGRATTSWSRPTSPMPRS